MSAFDFLSLAASSMGTIPRTLTVADAEKQVCQETAETGVGKVRLDGKDRYAAKPFTITDEQREAAIALAAAAVERHMAEYERTHCFGAYGNADRARMSMESLIKLRSPEQIAKMERERGLV